MMRPLGVSLWRGAFILAGVLGLVGTGALLTSQAAERDINPAARTPAAEVAISGEYWALLIGIDKYQHVESLETAVQDVHAVREVLIQRYGFAPGRISMLVNAQATRAAIEDTLYEIGQKTKPEDSVLIYYAGHGQTDPEKLRGWWVPVDGKAKSPGTFISNARVRDEMAAMKARHVYLVADSCFSGSLFGRSRAMPPLSDKIVARLYQDRSRWGLTSGMNEPVSDSGKGGHSIFAYFFLKLLRENQDPYLIPLQIYDRLLPLVANNSRQQPRSQPLQDAHDEGGQFVFRLTLHTKVGAAAPLAASPAAEPPKPIQEARLRPEAELDKVLTERKQQIEQIIARAFQLNAQDKEADDATLDMIVDMHLAAGNFAGALAQVNNFKRQRWRDMVLGGIAVAQAKVGDVNGALTTIDRISEKEKAADSLSFIGFRQLQRGDRSGASQTFQKAQRYEPGSSTVGVMYATYGDLDAAQQSLAGLSIPLQRNLVYSAIARAQAEKGDFLGAVQTVARLSETSFQASCLVEIAVIQAKKGDLAGAASTFRQAKRYGTQASDKALIAEGQARAGDLMGAMDTANLIEDEKSKAEGLVGIAIQQLKRGDLDGASKTVNGIPRSIKGPRSKFEEYAIAQAEVGDVAGAIVTLNDALQDDHWSGPRVWEAISKMLAKSGDVRSALALVSNQKELRMKLAIMKGVVKGLGHTNAADQSGSF